MTNSEKNSVAKKIVQGLLEERGYVVGVRPKGSWPSVLSFSHPKTSKNYRVIVKACDKDMAREKLWGDHYHFCWMADAKHEIQQPSGTVYAFVLLLNPPQLFLVPAPYVAWYVKFQHDKWLASRKQINEPTKTRRFRICEHDPLKFRDNWALLDNPDADIGPLMVDCTTV
jgi:hypothetical protein